MSDEMGFRPILRVPRANDWAILAALKELGPDRPNGWVPEAELARRIGPVEWLLAHLKSTGLVEQVTLESERGARRYWRLSNLPDAE